MENKQNKFNKIKKCEIKISKQLFLHNNINNLKSAKYFTFSDNNNNDIKKALTKYREINNKKKINNNINNKTSSTSDISKIYYQKKLKNKKSKNFKIDKKILTYAEPRLKLKEFHKIQPKIIDNDNNFNLEKFLQNNNEDNNTNKTIINENDITSSELEIIDYSIGLNKFKNYYEYSNNSIEKEYFLTEKNEKNNLNELFNINDINLEYLIMIEKLYDELIKDMEINKMDIYQNKLSITKDLLYIYNSENNNNLYNIIDNIILNDEEFFFNNNNNNTYNNKLNYNNNKNNNYNIILILKEYFILQIIFFYIIILISLFKKEKNIYQSGIHSISFYFHQNIIIFIYIIFSNFNLNDSSDNENFIKCNKLLNENKTWLDKNNYKKYIKTNNSLSKQIILNLLKQINTGTKNTNNNNNKIIELITNLLYNILITYKKKKIISIFQNIKLNKSINDLLKKLNFNKIISHYNESEQSEQNINNNTIPEVPYLLPISSKYKYTLVLDLDETLVHYVSDNDSAYIQIRPGAEEFIKDLSDYYEIIIFTAALQNYADLIISGLDPDNVISYKLYRQHTINIGGNSYIKDLDKLGRDITKIIIIDNISDNFEKQKENGLNICDFEGNEYDEELKYLKDDLIKLFKLKPNDVRYYLKDIQKNMDKRAIFFKNLNDKENINNDDNKDNEDESYLFEEIVDENIKEI